MFKIKFRKDSASMRLARLFLPFKPDELDEFIKREFTNDLARIRWSNLLLILGYGLLFSLTVNPLYIFSADKFWINWLMLFSSGIVIISGSLARKITDKAREKFETRILFLLVIFGLLVWVFQIINNGFINIWPETIAVELAIFGIGFLFSKKKLLLYGLILMLLSFIISAGHLLR